jgi:hypothetical protein
MTVLCGMAQALLLTRSNHSGAGLDWRCLFQYSFSDF